MKLLKSLMLVAVGFPLLIDYLLLLSAATSPKKDKVLLILLDAFRWDYVDGLPETGGFKKLIKSGVKAEHMMPIYPSESYPNYFAIATGLYAENHGVVSNYMYDPDEDVVFNMGEGKDSKRSSWFDKAEPIWVTAERNGIPTASLDWPSADIPIRQIRPQIASPYKLKLSPYSLQRSLRKAVNLLASGSNNIHFCQVFSEWTDALAHTFGPYIMKNYMVPMFIDDVIRDFLSYVKLKKLDQSLNIILLSDHGMTNTDPFSVTNLKLHNFFDIEDVNLVSNHGSNMGIFPKCGKEDKVYNQLKKISGIKVYKKDQIPDSYHLKNSNKVPPIFIETLKGYYISPINDRKQIGGGPVSFPIMGYHGYNPIGFADMWGTFIASGPAFRKGIQVPAINNVDVYNLLAHLLNISALPNNGTWNNVKDMLNADL
uniref:glycerophosphocholine cholinephosphodiesterase n=1 Tax=Strigamia maritima TaxID=126957 RepID=T1J3R9_STRMM